MTDQKHTQSISILHQPYGEYHPYIPLACERSPRDPCNGEPVVLNIETGNTPPVDALTCLWQIEGQADTQRIEAVKMSSDETMDRWQVPLPAFNGGEVVQYHFIAHNAIQQIESDKYIFFVSSWLEAKTIAAVEQDDQRLTVYFSTSQADLWIGLQVQSSEKDVLSIAITGHKAVNVASAQHPALDQVSAQWGDVHFSLLSNPLRIIIHRPVDGLLLQSSQPLQVLIGANGAVLQYRLHFESPQDEAFYGFGERFNALDQRGQHLDNRVYGQYTNQGKRSYLPVPFFLSSRGYGLWLKTDRQAAFDLTAEASDVWWLAGEVEDEHSRLELMLILAPTPREIVQTFSQLTGKPKLPPSWVFGLWMSSNDWNSQAEVIRQLQLAQEHQIPATVLVIEAWSDEINFYIWNDAQYELKTASETLGLADYAFPPEGRWPNPKAMIDELHQAGIRLVLWQNPAIKQAREDEHLDERLNRIDQDYAIAQDFVVKKADGSPHRVEAHMPWFGNSLVLDFTNPRAVDWWCKKRAYLVKEMGVDGFKTDGGEHIWDAETVFHNGMKGDRGINRYPVDYEEAYRLFMEKYRGDDFVLFSRAGYTGAQVNPCHWAGDENSTWGAFRASINAMLNVGISGVPFFGWDIAGFAGPIPTSELYLRATAFSVFCPIMQYHSDVNHHRTPSRDRTPWNIQEQTKDEDVIPMFRWFTNLRMNLLPYILSEATKSSLSGLPMTRALPLDFLADMQCRDYPTEYMFGDALLVAPVVQENCSSMQVYLPAGEWRDFWTGEVHHGPAVKQVETPRDFIPVYQRKSSMVGLHTDGTGNLGSPVGNRTDAFTHLTLRVFPGGTINESITLPGNIQPANIEVKQNADGGGIEIQLSALNIGIDLILYLKEPGSVMLDDQLLQRISKKLLFGTQAAWRWHANKKEVIIHLPEPLPKSKIKIQ